MILRDDGPREIGEGTSRDLRGDPTLLQELHGRRLALQERTFGFARELLENSADPEAEGMWATLEELADKSRGEHEQFERLARKSSEAYMKVLKKPLDEHHHKMEEAKADLEEASPS